MNTSNRFTKRTAAPIAAITAAAVLLSACITTEAPKQGAGTLLGAVGGALAGSSIGKGRGRVVAVAAGTILGAFVGAEIGRSLDRADRMAMTNAQVEAYVAPMGESIEWSNPDSGHYGEVRTTREGQTNTGRYCREYQHSVVINDQVQQAYGTACRQPDGSWQVIKGS
ncbi:MAG: glycine zipper 2TM domain-containing protein [Rhodospirillaceae bacterium]|jgi:surface antigen|nr:glycine zipper 2TM domain-containing protein [Rhodospirillaceae bacterium]MBT4046503.1 glycine zipper 2TM domain-containing protein [Rhodospirillaceae bacterium]MBT4687713.1 glycine zipper 2TM domain-containing protein [Rhodospirillaceae bacterium]MBT5082863.1 glycine zipper 2TM domain-containing protein [Rhodospirillaceae bacterium]MBT5524307.1 glycine zipper 2TM domain-containing protein [Rhodospirillaceae bacterium]